MRKKLFTFLLAMASAWTVFAANGTCGANLTWNLTDGVMTISGTGTMTNYAQPSHAPWYNYRSSISSIIIEDGATSIGNNAFSGCNKLTSVTCKATTPPTLYDYVFDVYFNDVPLYVPAASVETYKATSQWNNFDVQPINTEAIPSVFGTSANHSHKFFKDGQLIIEKNCKTYTIQGQEVK